MGIFFKQTVEILIRRRVLWRLIRVCTVYLCHTKMTLGLYGLIETDGTDVCRYINSHDFRTYRIHVSPPISRIHTITKCEARGISCECNQQRLL